jgi:hypothetical protein
MWGLLLATYIKKDRSPQACSECITDLLVPTAVIEWVRNVFQSRSPVQPLLTADDGNR